LAGKFTTTTKDVGLLRQLRDDGQLRLAPEFQRNAVWPRAAKAYLIDTMLSEKPIPVLYFQRGVSAQTGRIDYNVVDGQQRLSAVFQFIENRFSLTESADDAPWARKRWKALSDEERERILSYDFVVQELSGYDTESIRDMFTRMNRYVVALSPQELRHANEDGAFKRFIEKLGARKYWTERRIVSTSAANRMRGDEIAAELVILILEGPQDKKKSIDFYYSAFQEAFEQEASTETRLDQLLQIVDDALPNLAESAFRRPANFYALVGALNELLEEEVGISSQDLGITLTGFEAELKEEPRTPRAERYFEAASRQTDNIAPRRTRIDILKNLITKAG
jgi:hypothetical protein